MARFKPKIPYTTRVGNQLRTGFGTYGAHVTLSPHFLNLVPNKGDLLVYLANECIKRINTRTDQQLDINGQRFKPYAERYLYDGNDGDSKPAKDELGRWMQIRDPADPVTLRSQDDVKPKKRMRDWLRVAPAKPSPDASEVRIVQRGGRKDAYGTHVGHIKRARTCAATDRHFIGIGDGEWGAILGAVRRDHVLAFIEHRNAEVWRTYRKKVRRRAKRQLNKTKRWARAALRTAKAEHKRQVQKARRARQRAAKAKSKRGKA